ncbi:MAG: hypothetical protein HUK19_04470 [Fibrobacter sp.]|nr:hypothetical protein [Fibrobacter sp.]
MAAFCAIFAAEVSAGSLETQIQEAIYLFEMKGEKAEAIQILEKVAQNGDSEDKEKAYFYLGKIQELAGNKTSSNFYYKQSLSRTTETAKAYWLSEREAATSYQPENLQKSFIPLKNILYSSYGSNPAFLKFRDGSIKKIEDDKLVNLPIDLPSNIDILNVNPKGVWYQSTARDSLYFQSIYSGKILRNYAISSITDFFDNGEEAIAITENTLHIFNKKNVSTQIPNKYSHCQISGFFKPTNEYVLNCSDNALHFLSSEDGTESKTISQFDIIQKILIDKNQIFLTSVNYLYCYLPKHSNSHLWKIAVNNVESILPFANSIVILDASGKVQLIDKSTGFIKATTFSDASSIHPLAQGTLGLFTNEGSITTVDTLLRPIWNFNFTKPIVIAPIHTNGNIYLYFGDNKLRAISPDYYGKKELLSNILVKQAAQTIKDERWEDLPAQLDSLFKAEPGNAEGWFFNALYLEKTNKTDREKQKAWAEAVRLSASNPQASQYIFHQYSKAIGAKFVSLLPISPKTIYPQFFSNKKNLFTIDPAANKLLCLNIDNGELRWSRNTGKLDESPAIANNENTLAIASGYVLSIYDLNQEGSPTTVQLPGKAFETHVTDNAIYVSTWNGFLLKIFSSDNKLAWSRKIFSVPFLMAKNGKLIHLSNLEGDLADLDDESGQVKEGSSRKVAGSVTHIVASDSVLAVATNSNKLHLFNLKHNEKNSTQILLESEVTSVSLVNHRNEQKFIIGLADQSILLYTVSGAPLWKFQGRNSVFTKPYVKDDEAWIDQKNEVVAISLVDGKIVRKFNTPDGAGTPFITGKTLFSASPKRLLYGFSL